MEAEVSYVLEEISTERWYWQLVCCAFTLCWWVYTGSLEVDPPPGWDNYERSSR